MSKNVKYPTIAFGKRKRIDIGAFRGKIYFHLHDMAKDKSVTLNKEEFDLLFQLRHKINKKVLKINIMNKEEEENEKKNKKKEKESSRKKRESESSSDDGMGDSSDSDV